MDRGRDRDRRGDGEVTRMGNGESYRPSARGSRDRDRSPRRERARTPVTDTWQPRDRSPPRRRSRTPPRRSPMRENNWRARPRSPRNRSPLRRFSPRRDDDRRARSPPRIDRYISRDSDNREPSNYRRRSRSPFDRGRGPPRARSPLPSRRSPLPSRRSPPARPYRDRTRSRSPVRRDDRAMAGPSGASWRRRSPSPLRDSERTSGRTSASTSRRSSPHVHTDRQTLTQATGHNVRARSPPLKRERSPAPLVYRDREPARDSPRSTPREKSPPRASIAKSPPRGPSGFRAPPTGPGGSRNFSGPSAPTTHFSMSAHNKPENAGPVAPPAGPRSYIARGSPVRGAPYGMRGGRARPSFGNDRYIKPDPESWGAAPPSRPIPERENPSTRSTTPSARPTATPSPSISTAPIIASIPTGPSGGIPTGPRAGNRPGPALQHPSAAYGTRTSSISSTSNGPRPHPAMANMPQIISGGKTDPTMLGHTSEIAARLRRREEEGEVLREELNAKQDKLRQNLRVYDKLKAQSTVLGLRSELSERHVRMLAGEGVGGAAF